MVHLLGAASLNSTPRMVSMDKELKLILDLDGVYLIIQIEGEELMHMKLTQYPRFFVNAFRKALASKVYDIFPFGLEEATVTGHFASTGISHNDYILVEFRLPKYQELPGGRDRQLCSEPLIIRGTSYHVNLEKIVDILGDLQRSDEIVLEEPADSVSLTTE